MLKGKPFSLMMERTAGKQAWRQITGPEDIDQLMFLFGNFHDSCIREVHVATGHSVDEDMSMHCDWPTTVHLLVQRQWKDLSAIELRFEEVSELTLYPPPPGYASIIFRAAFFLRDGIFYWSDDGTWDGEPGQDNPIVASRRVWWRDASEWMGATLRYRTED